MGTTSTQLKSLNLWLESISVNISVTEVVAGHLNNLLSAQKNYREAVNLKKIKTAIAHKIRSTEGEFRNGEKVYYKRENLK